MKHADRLELCFKIQEYTDLFNDEFSEYCEALCATATRSECMSEDFEQSLDSELMRVYDYLKANAIMMTKIIVPEPYEEHYIEWEEQP